MTVVRCPSLPIAINTEKGENKKKGRKRKKKKTRGQKFWRMREANDIQGVLSREKNKNRWEFLV